MTNQMADDVPVTSPGAKHDVVRELYERFGQETFVFQPTLDDVPTLWVPREKLIEVLGYLRQAPKPYVMLLDLLNSFGWAARVFMAGLLTLGLASGLDRYWDRLVTVFSLKSF